MRLFSLSFMGLFVIGLLWEQGRRQDDAAGRKPAPNKRKDKTVR